MLRTTLHTLCLLMLLGFLTGLQADNRFNLDAYTKLYGSYDTNVLTSGSSESDFIFTLQPGVTGAALLRIGEVQFGVQPKFHLPVSQFSSDEVDLIQHDYYVQMLSEISRRIEVTLSDSFLSVSGDLAKPRYHISNSVTTNSARIDVAYQAPLSQRTSIDANVRAARIHVFSFDNDRLQYGGLLGVKREINPRLMAGVKLRAEQLIYDNSALNDATIVGADVFAKYELKNGWSINVPLGVQSLIVDGSQQLALFTDLNAQGPIGKRSYLTIDVERGFTFDSFGESFTRYIGEANIDYQVSGRMSAKGYGRITWFEQTALQTAADMTYTFGANLAYEVMSNIDAEFGGQVFWNRGEISSNDFDDYIIFIGANYKFLDNDQK